jgi:hypothetical protein
MKNAVAKRHSLKSIDMKLAILIFLLLILLVARGAGSEAVIIHLDPGSPGRMFDTGDTPRYFSDQKGTFEVDQRPQGGLCLAQIVPAEGTWWTGTVPKPLTLFGDPHWHDCVIEADVLLAGGDVEIGGRYADRRKLGNRWIPTREGRWQLNWQRHALASGCRGLMNVLSKER